MKIRILETWRPVGVDIQGRSLVFHPGDYAVPADMTAEMAERAQKETGAEDIDAPPAAPPVSPPEQSPPAPPKRKGPAPENKAMKGSDDV